MRIFNYRSEALRLLNFDSSNKISTAYRFVERHQLAKTHVPALLEEMKKNSMIHSISLGLSTDSRIIDKELTIDIILNNHSAKNYNERLILGYYKAFTAIQGNRLKDDDLFTASQKLQKLLFSEISSQQAFWRESNQPIYHQAADSLLKHHPLPAIEITETFQQACEQCQKVLSQKIISPLYIIPIFIVDVSYIQPFASEGPAMLRLLTLHILHNAGFPVFEYTCLDHQLRKDIPRRYAALEKSMLHWEEEINDYQPAFDYWLDVIQKACCTYNNWVSSMNDHAVIKQNLIEKYIKSSDGQVTKQMIRDFSIGISDATISLALSHLLKEGRIEKLHQGRSTAYRYIKEE